MKRRRELLAAIVALVGALLVVLFWREVPSPTIDLSPQPTEAPALPSDEKTLESDRLQPSGPLRSRPGDHQVPADADDLAAKKRQPAAGLSGTVISPVEVYGRVTNSSGPVASARLSIRKLLAGEGQKTVTATTSESGFYRVRLSAPELHSADIRGRDEFGQPVVLAENIAFRTTGQSHRQRQDFQVPALGLLEIQVVGPDDRPVSAAPVRIMRRDVGSATTVRRSSDARGEVRQQVGEGDYHLAAFVADRGWAGRSKVQVQGDEVTRTVLHLSPVAQVLRGTVIDAETRSPLSARIAVFREGQRHLEAGDAPISFEADDSGRFVLPIYEKGRFWIRVRRTAYREYASPPLDFSAQEPPSDLLVELEKGWVLAGQVRDGKGEPVAKAQVHLRLPGIEGKMTQITTQSKEGGIFQFDGLSSAEGELWADFSYARSAVQTVAIPDENVVLELVPAATVEGRVAWQDGRPFSDTFTLLLVRSGPISLDSFIPVPGRYQDSNGAFSISAIPPGHYRLHVNAQATVEGERVGISAQSQEFEVTSTGASGLLIVIPNGTE